MDLFPYNANNLLGGEIRAIYALESDVATVPTKPKDIFAQDSPYALATGWKDFGAARDPSTYERSMDLTQWNIQQAKAAVVEQVASVTRHLAVSIAEIKPETLQIIEQAPDIDTIAAIAGQAPYKAVGMGDFTSLTRYRVAFISMRDDSAGLVTESAAAVPPAGKRGRFVIGVGYSCSITADAASLEQAKAAESAFAVTFNFYPISGQPKGEDYGRWYLEESATIA